jgi:hypothetical protein
MRPRSLRIDYRPSTLPKAVREKTQLGRRNRMTLKGVTVISLGFCKIKLSSHSIEAAPGELELFGLETHGNSSDR